jgi:signal transduction histidine kinase
MTWLRRSRQDRLTALLVLVGLAAFVGTVYVVVVLGGGFLIGHTQSPQIGLSILATAIVALSFERVQSRLEGRAGRLVRGGRPSPYEVLNGFTDGLTGAYASEEVAARMAKVLAEGTGAQWSQVWLVVGERLTLAATWPPAAAADGVAPNGVEPPGRRALRVRQAGEVLGVLRLQEDSRAPLTPVEERLFAGLAGQAGLVLRGVRLRAERAQRLVDLAARAEELQESRERLVDTQDAERRRLERDIHDGAQQHLVAMAVNLRLAETVAKRSPERAARLLAAQTSAVAEMRETLVNLSRGIYPRLLSEDGVDAALRSAVARSSLPVRVEAHNVGRYAPGVEAAVYFCCLEAVQNAVKHSTAQEIVIDLRAEGDALSLVVEDDGHGFEPETLTAGVGVANMRDRIEAVGGTLILQAAPGGGAQVMARVPARQVPMPRTG